MSISEKCVFAISEKGMCRGVLKPLSMAPLRTHISMYRITFSLSFTVSPLSYHGSEVERIRPIDIEKNIILHLGHLTNV